jgi:transposase InsO family protein/predicted aspartyl protease
MEKELRLCIQDTPSHAHHMVCTAQILHGSHRIKARSLIDTGATSLFVSSNFVRANQLPTFECKTRTCRMADGSVAQINRQALITTTIGDHVDQALYYVTSLHNYDTVLGLSWLEVHNPSLDFVDRTVHFNKTHCLNNCLILNRPCLISVDGRDRTTTTNPEHPEHDRQDLDICTVSADAFLRMSKRKGYETAVLWPEDFSPDDDHAQCFAMTPEDYEKFMTNSTKTDPRLKLPAEYHEFADVFKHKSEFTLPERKPGIDHAINLKPGMEPPYKRSFAMNPTQLAAVKKHVDDGIAMDIMEPSNSPCASPVLLVKKPGGGIRVCVDYRALNALTVKDRYPIPLIKETLERLSKARFYTKLDIVAAFNNLRIRQGDEWMTAFITRYGLYQYKVMPFGLCNGPATWQRYMNNIMQQYLDDFVTVYLDDLLIYSSTLGEHRLHVRKVLVKLREAGLPVDIDKCEFHVQEVKYLGLILTPGGLKMDLAKVEAIVNWHPCSSVKDIQSFLGFANFYRKFIRGFSLIAKPLTEQTKKDHVFNWTPECQSAFEELKTAFTIAPILAHYDPDLETWLETDASNYVVAGVLSQMHPGPTGARDLLRPVAFFSKRMVPAECNYDIYDKELLAIVRSFEEWRPELMQPEEPIKVKSDHRNLQWFMETKQLNSRQARWAELLSQFNFVITYRPGAQGGKPDALTRRSQDLPEGDKDPRLANRRRAILRADNTDAVVRLAALLVSDDDDSAPNAPVTTTSPTAPAAPTHLAGSRQALSTSNPFAVLADLTDIEDNDDLEGGVKLPTHEQELGTHNGVEDDDDDDPPALQEVLNEAYASGVIQQEMKHCHEELAAGKVPQFMKTNRIEPSDCAFVKGMLMVNGRLYIPDYKNLRTRCIQEHHDQPLAGHQGIGRTFELVSRIVFWPKMWEDISQYRRNCHTCKRSTASRLKRQGTLLPNPVPSSAWRNIAVDFIVELPSSKSSLNHREYRNILTITDQLTKMVYFLPTDDLTPQHTARLFYERIFTQHGVPAVVTSDRGTQFRSHFMERLCAILGTRQNLSTAFHPQTDGASERTNQTLEQYIRSYCGYLQDDWVDWLPMAQFALNNHVNASTGMSPFYANYGRHPRMSFLQDLPQPPSTTSSQRFLMDDADTFAKHMEEVLTQMRAAASLAQAKQAHHAPGTPAVAYKSGDLVWLDARNIRTQRPSKKLDHKNLGPFEVIAPIGRRSYKLRLPPSMKVFDTFHTSLLTPAANDPRPGQRLPPPPPVVIERDGESSVEYEVDEVVDSRRKGKGGHLFYKLKWTNGEITEQPWSDLLPGSEMLVAQFHKDHPLKPGPPSSFKDKLELQVMGFHDESPHAVTAEAALAMKVPTVTVTRAESQAMKARNTHRRAELAMHINAAADGPRGPVNAVARARVVMEKQNEHELPAQHELQHELQHDLHAAIAVNEGDLWLLDVAGAPYWEGGSNVTK